MRGCAACSGSAVKAVVAEATVGSNAAEPATAALREPVRPSKQQSRRAAAAQTERPVMQPSGCAVAAGGHRAHAGAQLLQQQMRQHGATGCPLTPRSRQTSGHAPPSGRQRTERACGTLRWLPFSPTFMALSTTSADWTSRTCAPCLQSRWPEEGVRALDDGLRRPRCCQQDRHHLEYLIPIERARAGYTTFLVFVLVLLCFIQAS